jgi:hypothetical protein
MTPARRHFSTEGILGVLYATCLITDRFITDRFITEEA